MFSSSDGHVELVAVDRNHPETVRIFLHISKDYFSDIPIDKRNKFVQSIIDRQGEPGRWLFLLKNEDQYIGFIHLKLDGERPGWAAVLEFYIVPTRRRRGWGRWLFDLTLQILRTRNVKHVWLWSAPDAEPFWRTLGFQETGELVNDMKVMTRSV